MIARPQPATASEDRPAGPLDADDPAREQARRGTPRRPARRPSARARPGRSSKTSRARTGKSEVGIPKIIALRSIDERAEDRPSLAGEAQALADRVEARAAMTAPSGGSGLIASRATNEAMNDTRSTAYAPASPTVAIRIPPTAGPTIEAIWKLSWLRAIAAGRRSGGHEARDRRRPRRLVDGAEAGRDERDREQGRDRRRPGQREQDQGEAAGGQPGLGQAAAAGAGRRRRRASPPPSAKRRIGMSWKRVSAAIASVEPVRTKTWYGSAIRVIWLPMPLTTWPDHSQR